MRGGFRHFHKGGGLENKSDFKTISFKKYQKIPGRNSKRKLQNMTKRKITNDNIRTKLLKHIFTCQYLSSNPPLHPPMTMEIQLSVLA